MNLTWSFVSTVSVYIEISLASHVCVALFEIDAIEIQIVPQVLHQAVINTEEG